MKTSHCYSLLAAAILCAGAIVAHGRVFVRSNTVSDSTKALLSSGGSLAYETSITLNGGNGDLSIVGFNKRIAALATELGRVFNTKNIVFSGGSMGLITARANGQVVRLTLINISADSQKTLVFKLQQTESEFQASSKPPKEQMLKDIPAYPGSDPLFFAADNKANAGLAVSLAATDPASVNSFFASKLAASGWAPAIAGSTAPQATTGGMKVYVKDREICCVLVDPLHAEGKSRITVLHKRQGIE